MLLTRTGTPTTGVTFKWKLNGANISGATNARHSATVSGSYKVEVTITATGYKKTSPVQTVTINCKEASREEGFYAEAYPNPFTNSVTIRFDYVSSGLADLELTDINGRTIREYQNIDPSAPYEIREDLSPGIYFIHVTQNGYEQAIKLVKE